jgi:hypothetical protein
LDHILAFAGDHKGAQRAIRLACPPPRRFSFSRRPDRGWFDPDEHDGSAILQQHRAPIDNAGNLRRPVNRQAAIGRGPRR